MYSAALPEILMPPPSPRASSVNQLDIQLYAFAKRLFEHRLEAARRGGAETQALEDDVDPERGPEEGAEASSLVAQCVSGACAAPRSALRPDASHAALGQMWHDQDFLSQRPDCGFRQDAANHVGTLDWYNAMFGCAFDFDWFRTHSYQLVSPPAADLTFSTRTFHAQPLRAGSYALLIGAAQSMGVQTKEPYAAYIEQLTGLATVSLAWGGTGAGFYVDLLTRLRGTRLGRTALALVRNAGVVVVQVMSVRSESNSRCLVRCNNMYCQNGVPFVREMKSISNRRAREQAINESAAAWVDHHQQLLSLVRAESPSRRAHLVRRRLVVFLYQCAAEFGTKTPNVFPQFVNEPMVSAVLEHAQHAVGSGEAAQVSYVKATLPAHLGRDTSQVAALASARGCMSPGKRCAHPEPRGSRACTMETLQDRCECSALHINYYPTPRLQLLTGAKVAHEINRRGFGIPLEAPAQDDSRAASTLRFFMLLSQGRASLRTRFPLAALESACKHHPGAQIFIYISAGTNAYVDPELVRSLRSDECGVDVLRFDPRSFFEGTPLQGWIAARLDWLRDGQFWYSHSSDLFRLAALWRFGGWYLDTDVIILRPLSPLRNCLAWQGNSLPGYGPMVNNAVSHFDARHPLLEAAMRHVRQAYQRDAWPSAGPGAITSALQTWKQRDCEDIGCVRLLNRTAFFPKGHLQAKELMTQKITRADFEDQYGSSFVLHFWNKLTAGMTPVHGSVFARAYNAGCTVCSLMHSHTGEAAPREI